MSFALIDTAHGDLVVEVDTVDEAVQRLRDLHAADPDGSARIEIFEQDPSGRFADSPIPIHLARPAGPARLIAIEGVGEGDAGADVANVDLRLKLLA